MSLSEQFYSAFIKNNRWQLYLQGLGKTIEVTFFAAMLGLVLGTVACLLNMQRSRNGKRTVLSGIAYVYIDVIRGTPTMIQLLIMWNVIMAASKNKILVASLAFGINSGAYVAEILRGGIMSIDKGQFEAGRSLGFNYVQTMYYIVIPQVLKNVLPALLNEFIALLKETSVAGYVGVVDLTRAGNAIRGATFSAFMPLIAVALIYLAIVLILTKLVGIIERRMRKSER